MRGCDNLRARFHIYNLLSITVFFFLYIYNGARRTPGRFLAFVTLCCCMHAAAALPGRSPLACVVELRVRCDAERAPQGAVELQRPPNAPTSQRRASAPRRRLPAALVVRTRAPRAWRAFADSHPPTLSARCCRLVHAAPAPRQPPNRSAAAWP